MHCIDCLPHSTSLLLCSHISICILFREERILAHWIGDIGQSVKWSCIHNDYSITHSLFRPFTHFTLFEHFTLSFPPHWFLCLMISSHPILTKLCGFCVASLRKTDRDSLLHLRLELKVLRREMCLSAQCPAVLNMLRALKHPWHIYELVVIILPLRPFITSKEELCLLT